MCFQNTILARKYIGNIYYFFFIIKVYYETYAHILHVAKIIIWNVLEFGKRRCKITAVIPILLRIRNEIILRLFAPRESDKIFYYFDDIPGNS